MNNADLVPGDDELQRLAAVRHRQLSCLFDVDSQEQVLPPPTPVAARPGDGRRVDFPNHNPLLGDPTAALAALGGKSRRQRPGGSKAVPPTPPGLSPTPSGPRLPTQAELAARYGSPTPPSAAPWPQSLTPPTPGTPPSERLPRRRRPLLPHLWRRLQWLVRSQPQAVAQHVGFMALGALIRFLAPSPALVPVVLGISLLTVVALFLFCPGWREQRLTACLLLGLWLSTFLFR